MAEEEQSCKRQRSMGPPEGGYGWVVVMACAVCMGSVQGISRATALVYMAIIEDLNLTRTEASAVPVTSRVCVFVCSIFVGKLMEKYSYRSVLIFGTLLSSTGVMVSYFIDTVSQLVFTYGFLMGVGMSFMLMPGSLGVGLYFVKRRSLAMGVMYFLSGSLAFLIPIIYEVLIAQYTLRGAFLVIGGGMLNCAAFGYLITPPPWLKKPPLKKPLEVNVEAEELESFIDNKVEQNENKENQLQEKFIKDKLQHETNNSSKANKELTIKTKNNRSQNNNKKGVWRTFLKDVKEDCALFKDAYFLLTLVGRVSMIITVLNIQTILVDFAVKESLEEISKKEGAFLLSIVTIGDTLSRFLTGFLLDHIPFTKKTLNIGINILLSGLTISIRFSRQYIPLMISSGIYGVVSGCAMLLNFLTIMELIGPKKTPLALGIMQLIAGPLSMGGGIVLGYIRDTQNSYSLGFFLLGGVAFISALVWFSEPLLLRCLSQKKPSQTKQKIVTAEQGMGNSTCSVVVG